MNSNFKAWLQSPYIDSETKLELKRMSEEEIEDNFNDTLTFGTGGVRSIMGIGTNKINIYTIRRLAEGFSYYLNQSFQKSKVLIAYDTRQNSKIYAEETAKILQQNDIEAFVFEEPTPTPLLSFAVKNTDATAGIVITASHNPSEYNGFKIYTQDGVQAVPKVSNEIANLITKAPEIIAADKTTLIKYTDTTITKNYLEILSKSPINKKLIKEKGSNLKIVYSALHGTGANWVPKALRNIGFENLNIIEEQNKPDPDFSTLESPNPEEISSYEMSLKEAHKTKADIILTTDPDADRLGIMFKKNNGEYTQLSGNKTGALLVDYILRHKTLPENGLLIKTIVTDELGSKIAEAYNVKTINTLTGFKFIGEQIDISETNGKNFIFGYEESCGFLSENHCRDKDGILAALLISEMTLFHLTQGNTLDQALDTIYKQYNYYEDHLENINLTGPSGTQKIQFIMENFRVCFPELKDLIKIEDYLTHKSFDLKNKKTSFINLPKTNALKFTLSDNSWFCLRPSGTEPKLKIYFSTNDKNQKAAQQKLQNLRNKVLNHIKSFDDNAHTK